MRRATVAVTAALALSILSTTADSQEPARRAATDTLTLWLQNAERETGAELPDAGEVRTGNQTVASGERIEGDLVTVGGDITVAGEVDGDVAALDGSVILLPGAIVRGSAVSAGGEVRLDGGTVEGEIVETVLRSTEAAAPVRRSPVRLALGWAIVLAVTGVVALLLARRNLERVADAVRIRFGRSLLVGVVGQLAFFPALLAIIVVLAITIIGLLVIPIALVAFLTAVAGAVALGFLAVAYASGDTLARRRGRTAPTGLALFLGLGVYVAGWVLAAALTNVVVVGPLLRALVGLVTWVALSVGFGATLITRGGSRDVVTEAEPPSPTPDDAWQTPTPVSGVAAARRPTPAPGTYRS